MRRALRRVALWLALATTAVFAPQGPGAPALAQQQDGQMATLVADKVRIEADARLVAEGNVEVFYGTTQLKAARITYARDRDVLTIEGPLTLIEGTEVVVLADAATLGADLRDGILSGARMVLNQQLQLAATEITRVGARYTQLTRTVASSCQVCPGNPVPLWEIRARRVVHDQLERQLYFDNAQFRVMGVPVFYVPRLRMPDPTLKRASGVLMPRIRSTTTLGFGLKLPYFMTFGDSRDLTLTPYLSDRTRTLEFRYRQAFRNGGLEFRGAVTDDDLTGSGRGYLFGSGYFALPRDFLLTFALQTVSDRTYLLDYDYSDLDRLTSGVEVTRTRRTEYIGAQIQYFESLRDGDINSQLPSLVGEFTYDRRFVPAIIGGDAAVRFQTYSLNRSSDLDVLGRDTTRASATLDWRRNWLLPGGLVASALGEVTAEFFAISHDSNFPGTISRVTPVAAVELRWPLVRAQQGGVVQVIEPVAQIVYTPQSNLEVPNEDSTLVEFDEGNLFALNRFPGADAHEQGLRANLGVTWKRIDPAGVSVGLTVGRVLRAEDLGQFSKASGLGGARSDWLAAVQLRSAAGISLINRTLFDESFRFSKNELRLGLSGADAQVATSLIYLVPDEDAGRPLETSEWALDASYRFHPQWTGTAGWKYDFSADQAKTVGVGLTWRTECVSVDVSLSRRFTTSISVTPTTDFSLSVDLIGFGSGAGAAPLRRHCTR